jgi:hypothetical protein
LVDVSLREGVLRFRRSGDRHDGSPIPSVELTSLPIRAESAEPSRQEDVPILVGAVANLPVLLSILEQLLGPKRVVR